MPLIRSLHELYQRCKDGDEQAQQLCIAALENLGCEHLAMQRKRETNWQAHYTGLIAYVSSLVAEHGVNEDKAFAQVVDEVNNCMRILE